MKDFLKDNIFKIGVAVPVLGSVLGMIIINLYLSNYGIIEYAFFKTHSILVGSVFLFFVISIVVYYSLYFDLVEPQKNNLLLAIIILVIKTFLISLLTYTILINKFFTYSLPFNIKLYPAQFRDFIFRASFGLLVPISLFYDDFKEKRMSTFLKVFVGILISIGLVMIIILYWILQTKEPVFQKIAYFYSFFGILMLVYLFARKEGAEKREDPNYKPTSLFSMYFSKRTLFMEITFVVISLITVFSLIVATYASNIYPYIPQNFGGGKIKPISITYDKSTIQGSIIHSNDKMIFVLDKTKKITIIKWDNLIELKPIK